MSQSSLLDVGPTVSINGRCLVRTEDGLRVVVGGGIPIAHYAVGDGAAEAYAMVQLVTCGWADQVEVARAFGCSTRTVRRHERRFEEGGLTALGRASGYPRGRARVPARSKLVGQLHAGGHSNRAIAARVGVTEKAVRKQLRRLGVTATQRAEQQCLPMPGADPNLSARPIANASVPEKPAVLDPPVPTPAADPNLSASPPPALSLDTDPADRRFDRLLAHVGLIDDARPIFRAGMRVPNAGVLLALGPLLDSGVLDVARDIYGSIGPAFYGLRTTLVALMFMALLRIKRAEALKEHPPDDLGRLLGLDRAPEVKTLRRKLARLASLGRATEFGQVLAQRRVAAHGAALGFLYVDGHVRVYHGKHTLPKAHVARMRIAMPATTDYWVNDIHGDPLFVVTAKANAGLVAVLPGLLDDVRDLIKDRRVTIVFDRGGWSPKLFVDLLAKGFDILTYRKGRSQRVPKSRFERRKAKIEGHDVDYVLADQNVRFLNGKLRLRQVTRLSPDGHQTQIITSRTDLPAVEIAFRMFERWQQENFFKYLREEYALDALVQHDIEPDDPLREVPNPRWAEVDAELRLARAAVQKLSAVYGIEALANPEAIRRTMRGFKITHAAEAKQLVNALQRVVALDAKRAKIPRRVPVQRAIEGAVVKLAAERKHLTDILKMIAYQAESQLLRLIAPHYKRADDEGRTLIQNILASPADIDVDEHELRITLAPLSSEHRTRVATALCNHLDARGGVFPGTGLRVRYAVASGA